MTPSGEHNYNFSAQHFVRLSEIVNFLNFWHFANFFLRMCIKYRNQY